MHTRGGEFLRSLTGLSAKIIAEPSSGYEGPLYRQRTVETLLRAGAQFAIRRLKNRSSDQAARPRRIVLFYVPAEDEQRLLEAFDFFVFPVPLRGLDTYDESGTQRRRNLEQCEHAIRKAVDVYKNELVGLIQRRIESRKSSELLLLPPANFKVSDQSLKQTFCELTRRVRAWENAAPEGIVPEIFDRDMLPDFLDHQEHQAIFRDSRKVVFPCARPTELHAAQDLDHQAEASILREVLRSMYRFGTSLPQGFHHDAQFGGGRHFNQMSFDCSRNGRYLVTASHANIYPNDFVRPGP